MAKDTSEPPRAPRQGDGRERMREAADEVAGVAKQRMHSALEHGKQSAAAAAGQAKAALDRAADTLAEDGEETLAGAVAAIARQFSSLADYVGGHSIDDLMRDARRLANRHPASLLVGGIALGVALSRYFKASEPREEESLEPGASAYGGQEGTGGARH